MSIRREKNESILGNLNKGERKWVDVIIRMINKITQKTEVRIIRIGRVLSKQANKNSSSQTISILSSYLKLIPVANIIESMQCIHYHFEVSSW